MRILFRYMQTGEPGDAFTDQIKRRIETLNIRGELEETGMKEKLVIMDARREGREEGRMEGEKLGLEKGLYQGRQEGIQQGIQKGRQEGRQEGIALRENQLNARLNELLSEGIITREICDAITAGR